MTSPSVLLVSGWDSSGGAGMTVDLKAVQATGFAGTGIISTITAQTHSSVRAIQSIDESLFSAQLRTALNSSDKLPDACKIGLLTSTAQVRELAECLPESLPVVLDPVIYSSSGVALTTVPVIAAIKQLLLPRCYLLTPNLDELQQLTGITNTEPAVKSLLDTGCSHVLVKGGHAEGDIVIDRLFHYTRAGAINSCDFSHQRQPGNFRGTGCLLSTAIACQVATGAATLEQACSISIDFLQKQLANTPTNGDHAVRILLDSRNTSYV